MHRLKDAAVRHREGLLYLVSGVVTTAVSWGTYAVLRRMLDVSNPVVMNFAVLLRFIAAASAAYVMNRVMVFQSRDPRILTEMLRFFSGRIGTLVIDMFIMWLLPTVLCTGDWFATFVSQVVVTVLNYIAGKFFVFRRGRG